MSSGAEGLAESERTAALDAEVAKHVRKGYRVMARTPTTAQLVKPKGRFGWLWFTMWVVLSAPLLLAVPPLGLVAPVGYVLYHLTIKKDQSRYLTVDEGGKVRATKG